MKDLLFTKDLLTLLQHDKFYGVPKNLSAALRKFGLQAVDRADNLEQMRHALAVHVMDQRGESEPFLTEAFIYPEALIKLLKEHGLPAPAALHPAAVTPDSGREPLDEAQFEQCFELVCRNCGTVTDPLAAAYRTPLGRLIFRAFLVTRRSLGINTTAKYVFEHLAEFDTEKIISSVGEDYVIWKTGDSGEKLTSLDTIGRFVLKFNRELQTLP